MKIQGEAALSVFRMAIHKTDLLHIANKKTGLAV